MQGSNSVLINVCNYVVVQQLAKCKQQFCLVTSLMIVYKVLMSVLVLFGVFSVLYTPNSKKVVF